MSLYREQLPFNGSHNFITDGGLETSLVFDKGYDLPEFAAFVLLENEKDREVLKDYFIHYVQLARKYDQGLVLEAPTWRASDGWGKKIGYNSDNIKRINRLAIEFLFELRKEIALKTPCVISGCIGPIYDGYNPQKYVSSEESLEYHRSQIECLSKTQADMVSAFTITSIAEATGICNAANEYNMPVIISFTVETDGNLPSGESIQDAILQVDAMARKKPEYYMINCAHPSHFKSKLDERAEWLSRIGGVRANASCKSHAELDKSTELDAGDPQVLGNEYVKLQQVLSKLKVMGGCCGTDHRHIEQMCKCCFH